MMRRVSHRVRMQLRASSAIPSSTRQAGSAMLSRKMALKVASDEACSYLTDVFWYDWDVTP
jgi:hypothetical protein